MSTKKFPRELSSLKGDEDGIKRTVRKRPRATMHESPKRKRGKRINGTNGSMPVSVEPKPPAICVLYEDLEEPEELPAARFGQYPKRLIGKMLPYLQCKRSEILHVCSGSLRPGEGIRVDVSRDARPDVLADGRALPFADNTFRAVMLDPPYTEQYAKELYGIDYPRPSHLLAEAARVVQPCGRIAFVHYLVPRPPPGCTLVKVKGLSTGFGYPMRAVTVFEKNQESLL